MPQPLDLIPEIDYEGKEIELNVLSLQFSSGVGVAIREFSSVS